MIVLQSVSVLCCLMSAALTDAVGTLTASSSLTSIMAGPTVSAHAQFAAGNRRSTVTAPAQCATANMRLMDCTPPFHRLSYSSHPRSFITPVCLSEAPIVDDSVTSSPSRPVPRPCQSDAAMIVFHQHPELLGPDTCVMTLYTDSKDHRVLDDIAWVLDMALEKLQIAGYTRSALILDRADSKYVTIQEILTAAGFQLQIERSSTVFPPKEVIWVKDLPSAQAENVSAEATDAPTPLITVSGAVPHPNPDISILTLDPDALEFDQNRLKQIRKQSILVDLIDIKLQKFHNDGKSYAVVKMDRASDGSEEFEMAISALQQLGFHPQIENSRQMLSSENKEFWLKEI